MQPPGCVYHGTTPAQSATFLLRKRGFQMCRMIGTYVWPKNGRPYQLTSGMSAFPEGGRSDRQKLSEIKVRFRPETDVKDCLRSVFHSGAPVFGRCEL